MTDIFTYDVLNCFEAAYSEYTNYHGVSLEYCEYLAKEGLIDRPPKSEDLSEEYDPYLARRSLKGEYIFERLRNSMENPNTKPGLLSESVKCFIYNWETDAERFIRRNSIPEEKAE